MKAIFVYLSLIFFVLSFVLVSSPASAQGRNQIDAQYPKIKIYKKDVPVTELNTEELFQFRTLKITLEKFPPNRSTITRITLDHEGKGIYQTIKNIKGRQQVRENMGFNISQKQLEYIYYEIMRNQFTSMKKVVGSPRDNPAYAIKISMRADYINQTVTVYGKHRLTENILDGILYTIPYEYAYRFDHADWYY